MNFYTVNGRDEKYNKVRIRRASLIQSLLMLYKIRLYVSSKVRGNNYSTGQGDFHSADIL